MGYSTTFTGFLKFTISYDILSEFEKERLDLFLEGSCQDCASTLVNKVCDDCLKKIKPIRVPLRLYQEVAGFVLGVEWDQSEKAYNVPELLKALVLMMRQFNPEFGFTGKIQACGDRTNENYEIICCDGIPYKKTKEEVVIEVTENMSLSDVLEVTQNLDCDLRIKLSDQTEGLVNYKVWEREYNGNRIIIDGGYQTHNIIFYFLEEDFQKYCRENKSIVFENLLGNTIKVLNKDSFYSFEIQTAVQVNINLKASTILNENDCKEMLLKELQKSTGWAFDTSFFKNWGELEVTF